MLTRIPTAVIAVGVTLIALIVFAVIFLSLVFGQGDGRFIFVSALAAVLLCWWMTYILHHRTKPWRAVFLHVGSVTVVALCVLLIAMAIVARSLDDPFVNLVNRGWFGFVFVRFVDLVSRGWVGFVFVRLVVLLLVALAIQRLWRRFAWIAASVTFLALIGLGAVAAVKSHSPDGTYGYVCELEPVNTLRDIPELYHKDHFWRFSHDKVEDCFGNRCAHYGRYEKTADGWIVIHEVQEPYTWKLQFSMFGYRLIRPEDGDATAFCPRRIIPFARPYWMPDWLQ